MVITSTIADLEEGGNHGGGGGDDGEAVTVSGVL